MNASHPAITHHRAHPRPEAPPTVDGAWLRERALAAGADDVAFVSLDHPDLAVELAPIREALPAAVSLVSFVVRMARTPVRSPLRSLSNGEFHRAGDEAAEVGDALVDALEAIGVPALNPSVGFPMEAGRFPGRMWAVSHKRVAEAAGLGKMGVHRNVIHPTFGNFILLGTVIVGRPIVAELRQLDFNPCLDCRLCVTACPVGAVHTDGSFDFSACLTHNYREFMGGFNDLLGTVTESRDRWDLRARTRQGETVSWWQSLAFGPNYKAAYCMAVCPAGEDVIGPFLDDKKGFVTEVLAPLRDRAEPVYVMPGSDAEAHVTKVFPHKEPRRVDSGLYVDSIGGFLRGAPLLFQRGKAKGVDFVAAFRFTGAEPREATLRVTDGRLTVADGVAPDAGVTVTMDGSLWLDVVNGRRSPVLLVVTGRMHIAGDRKVLDQLQRCFPDPAK